MDKHYIRQLIDGEPQEWVHSLFTRYGKGEYLGPACDLTKKKSGLKFKGSYDYASGFGAALASGGGSFAVTGSLFGKLDFRDGISSLGLSFDDKSKPKKGYYVVAIDEEELPAEIVRGIYEAAPWTSALLNLKGDAGSIKAKKSPPKPGKEKARDFISGTIKDEAALSALIDSILFDVGDYSEASVDNTFKIEGVVIPSGMDAAQARLDAKRKGKLIRNVTVDGASKVTECDLLV